MKYITKVDAFKWTGDKNQTDDPLWIIQALKNQYAHIHSSDIGIISLNISEEIGEGNKSWKAERGDWIVRWQSGKIGVRTDKRFNEEFNFDDGNIESELSRRYVEYATLNPRQPNALIIHPIDVQKLIHSMKNVTPKFDKLKVYKGCDVIETDSVGINEFKYARI